MNYLGDLLPGQTLHTIWSSNGADGASITRATNGTISVYKDNGTTQSTSGITDTEDFDSLTGIHALTIDLGANLTFYSAGSNFTIVLSGATIDGKSVNAVIGHFSIMNRAPSKTMRAGQVSAANAVATQFSFRSDSITEATASHFIGRSVYPYTGALAGQCIGVITAYSLISSEGAFTISGSPVAEAMADNDWFVII